MVPILASLYTSRLEVLDITGNGIGDAGAYLLANALRANKLLRVCLWDDNSTTPAGFTAMASALSAYPGRSRGALV